jgi:hypothetical protein
MDLYQANPTVIIPFLYFFFLLVSGAGREGAFLFEVRQAAAP